MNRYIEAYRCNVLSARQYSGHVESGGSYYDMTGQLLHSDFNATLTEFWAAEDALN